MSVFWTEEAITNLLDNQEFISRDSPERAEKFIDQLIDQAESLNKNPQMGRIVPEFSNPHIRELIIKEYRIIYRTGREKIEILTVFEGHRLLRTDDFKMN